MKNFILLVSILFITSCYHTNDLQNNLLYYKHYSDNYNFGDTISFIMDCTINSDYSELLFIKKHYIFKDTSTVQIIDKIYNIKHDTVIITSERYKYSIPEFKDILIQKNKIKRDSCIFKFTENMYCTWNFFDEIYNCIVNY